MESFPLSVFSGYVFMQLCSFFLLKIHMWKVCVHFFFKTKISADISSLPNLPFSFLLYPHSFFLLHSEQFQGSSLEKKNKISRRLAKQHPIPKSDLTKSWNPDAQHFLRLMFLVHLSFKVVSTQLLSLWLQKECSIEIEQLPYRGSQFWSFSMSWVPGLKSLQPKPCH